jgi:hypothetical protein
VGQGGVQIASPVLLYVSIRLDTLEIYSTDRNEGRRAHVGLFRAKSDPLHKGVKSQILRLCHNAACGCLALWGTCFGMYA